RMGTDKATLTFRGRPLWQRQLELLRALRPDKLFVSVRSLLSWLPEGVELVVDDPPSRGPLSGLTKSLKQSVTSHLLVLAVDMPFMTVEQLKVLCRFAEKRRGVVPVIDGRFEPLA